jgi:TolB-like protein
MSGLTGKLNLLLDELKRRKVYRVAAAYAAFAFIVVQVADLLLPAFDMSDWVYRMVVVLALIGFPVAVVLAWIFEWTPAGVRITPAADQSEQGGARAPRFRTSLELIVAVLAIGGAISASWYLAGPGSMSTEIVDRSIAVLPFVSMNPNQSDSFTDGIHDDLSTRLSGIHGLNVIARSSAVRYRQSDKSPTEIAAELSVRWVLEGTVQRTGNQVRVSASLVDPGSGLQAWADSYVYDLSAENLFFVQSEITHMIAAALQTRLTTQEERIVSATPTKDLQAFGLVVEAETLLKAREEAEMRRALSLFEQALALDPNFSRAWVGVADSLYELVDYGFDMPDDSVDRAMRAAEHAIRLDPENPAAFVSSGIIYHLKQDGLEAMRRLEHAIELRPSYADAFSKVSWVAQILGRPQLAAQTAEKAMELNPLAVEPRVNFALTRLMRGEFGLALDTLRPDNNLIQDWPTNRFYEGVVLYHMGRYPEAIEVLDGLSIPWAGRGPEATLALAHAASGNVEIASRILSELEKADAHAFLTGLVHASLGESEAALADIDSIDNWTADADWPVLSARYLYPKVLDPLRSDPRYDRLLRSIDRAWGLVM